MIYVLRIILGLLFLFLLPGYALVSALFPRRTDLDGLERLGLGIGVSIAVTVSIAVLLNYSPWGIQFGSVVISVGSFILLASLVILYRFGDIPPTDWFVRLDAKLIGQPSVLNVFGFVALLILLATVFGIGAYLGTSPERQENFSQFYVLGATGNADDYPSEITADQPVTVMMGVVNHEHEALGYRVEQQMSDGVNVPIATFQLGHGEKWEQPHVFILTRPGDDQRITFLLYKEDEVSPYRSLHLWITVKQKP